MHGEGVNKLHHHPLPGPDQTDSNHFFHNSLVRPTLLMHGLFFWKMPMPDFFEQNDTNPKIFQT